jgi:hypothetical protein
MQEPQAAGHQSEYGDSITWLDLFKGTGCGATGIDLVGPGCVQRIKKDNRKSRPWNSVLGLHGPLPFERVFVEFVQGEDCLFPIVVKESQVISGQISHWRTVGPSGLNAYFDDPSRRSE